jgi:hypothetical protein
MAILARSPDILQVIFVGKLYYLRTIVSLVLCGNYSWTGSPDYHEEDEEHETDGGRKKRLHVHRYSIL